MRFAIIEGGIVVNTAEAETSQDVVPVEGQQVVQSDAANIGDSYDGSTFTPPAPAPEPAMTWPSLQQRAQSALERTDTVALRCFKAGIPFPSEWQAYTVALRAIVSAQDGDPAQGLPVKPPYPSGA